MLETIVAMAAFITIIFVWATIINRPIKKEIQEIKKGDIYQTALFPENPFAKMEEFEITDIKEDWVKCQCLSDKQKRSMRISYLKTNYTLKEEKE